MHDGHTFKKGVDDHLTIMIFIYVVLSHEDSNDWCTPPCFVHGKAVCKCAFLSLSLELEANFWLAALAMELINIAEAMMAPRGRACKRSRT